MLYVNQLDYPHVRYEHNVENGGVPPERQCIKTSGCGICCVCMVVEHLTNQTLSLEACVQLNYEAKANVEIGTRMNKLGPLAAERFGMEYRSTDKIEEALRHLQQGGEVIINVGGSHDAHIGIYSKGGHYILAIGYDGEHLCILDPAYREGKFDADHCKGRVLVDAPFTYCAPELIVEDTQNRATPYYLFSRKKPQ